MSRVVDTNFSETERLALLAEVRSYLPAYLSAVAAEQPNPVDDVKAILNLEARDLERVTAVHVLLSEPVRRLAGALRQGMRRPITSSVRPREVARTIRGPIDWTATWAYRATSGGDRTQFVVRPALRIFDTPENRALVWLLDRLDVALSRVPRPRADVADDADVEELGWFLQLDAVRNEVRRARRAPWLSEIPAERPSASALRRLDAARTSFYRRDIGDAVRAVIRWTERPSANDLTDLLCKRHFTPKLDWQLFELVVALRLTSAIQEKAGRRVSRLLVGGSSGQSPFAVFRLPDGELRLWFQRWPGDAGPSAHLRARQRHALTSGGPRPDLVVQRTGAHPDAAILELKATRSGSYLASGLSQLLGYLADRPSLFANQPGGWLVSPDDGPFEANEHETGDLWMVGADGVAEAVVERFL